MSQTCVLGINKRRRFDNLHGGLRACDLHAYYEGGGRVHHQHKIVSLLRGKPRRANAQFVGRGRHLEKLVDSLTAGVDLEEAAYYYSGDETPWR